MVNDFSSSESEDGDFQFPGVVNLDNSMVDSEQGSQGGLMMNNSITHDNEASLFGANRGYPRRGASINVNRIQPSASSGGLLSTS